MTHRHDTYKYDKYTVNAGKHCVRTKLKRMVKHIRKEKRKTTDGQTIWRRNACTTR